MRRCKACRGAFQTLARCSPSSRKGRGVPVCQLVLPGGSSFRGQTPRGTAAHTQKRRRRACVWMYMRLYNHANTLTHTRPSLSAHRRALQPQGEAPASPPARAGQAEHLAPQRGHRRPRSSTPTVLPGSRRLHPYSVAACWVVLFFFSFTPSRTVTRARCWTAARRCHKVNPCRLLSHQRISAWLLSL